MADLPSRPLVGPPKAVPALTADRQDVALALGGGGARGLAHILVLETFDELGVKPKAISGTSIGAIFGAAYASGLSARQIRAHTEEALSQKVYLARHLFAARADVASKWLNFVPIRPAILNAEALLDLLLPSRVARDFAHLQIPLAIVATDFYGQEQRVFTTGPLRKAVAASMALPAIFTPVVVDGEPLVDGGLVNPLPFDLLEGAADLIVAIDVSGAPARDANRAQPSAIEVLLSASQIFQRSIIREKLRARAPDVYIECPVDSFTVLDFHRYQEVMKAAQPVKDQLKRQLDRLLSSEAIEPLPVLASLPAAAAPTESSSRPKKFEKAKALIKRRNRKSR